MTKKSIYEVTDKKGRVEFYKAISKSDAKEKYIDSHVTLFIPQRWSYETDIAHVKKSKYVHHALSKG